MKQFKHKPDLSRMLLFPYGNVEWGSRWLGLKEILIEKSKCQHSSAELAKFLWVSAAVYLLNSCERGPTFFCSQTQLNFPGKTQHLIRLSGPYQGVWCLYFELTVETVLSDVTVLSACYDM